MQIQILTITMTNTLHKQIQIGTCVQIQIGERQWARFVSRWCQTCPFATQLYSLVYILLFTITCPSAIRTALQYQHHLHCFRCLLAIYIYIRFLWGMFSFWNFIGIHFLRQFHKIIFTLPLLSLSVCVAGR